MLRNTIVFPETDQSDCMVLYWTEEGVKKYRFGEEGKAPTSSKHGRVGIPQNVFDQIARLDKPENQLEFNYFAQLRMKSRSRMATVLALEVCENRFWIGLPGHQTQKLKDVIRNQMPAGPVDEAYEILRERCQVIRDCENDSLETMPDNVLGGDLDPLNLCLERTAKELRIELRHSLWETHDE